MHSITGCVYDTRSSRTDILFIQVVSFIKFDNFNFFLMLTFAPKKYSGVAYRKKYQKMVSAQRPSLGVSYTGLRFI